MTTATTAARSSQLLADQLANIPHPAGANQGVRPARHAPHLHGCASGYRRSGPLNSRGSPSHNLKLVVTPTSGSRRWPSPMG